MKPKILDMLYHFDWFEFLLKNWGNQYMRITAAQEVRTIMFCNTLPLIQFQCFHAPIMSRNFTVFLSTETTNCIQNASHTSTQILSKYDRTLFESKSCFKRFDEPCAFMNQENRLWISFSSSDPNYSLR